MNAEIFLQATRIIVLGVMLVGLYYEAGVLIDVAIARQTHNKPDTETEPLPGRGRRGATYKKKEANLW